MSAEETEVLVVGAGPVGMTAALLLERLGIEHRIVERREGPHRAPQAHVVNPRTLEIFRSLEIDLSRLTGLATPREDGGKVRWMTTLTGEELGSLPYERQDDAVLALTPTPLLNLSQHLLEPVLLETLELRAREGVRFGHKWETLSQDDGGVTSHVRDGTAGTSYNIRSRYLLAADGAGSRVREALGIEMLGPPRIQSFVMIHCEANLRSLVRERPAILYWILDPRHSGAFVAHDIDRSWVFMHPFDPDAEDTAGYTDEVCANIVRRAIGDDDVALTIRDVSTWHMTCELAERYREGNVFLIGDAAHRFPPAGGMGMNSGIQDAHNLIWKLAAVERGWTDANLLDTYETERRPVAQINADQSLANAVNLLEVYAALDLTGPESRLILDDAHRARATAAIAEQQDHFDMLGLQLGFRYRSAAVLDDGAAAPQPANPVRDFLPSAQPGSRVPHAWVRSGARELSLLDLLSYDRYSLIVGPQGQAWLDAALQLELPVPIALLMVGRDFSDPGGLWQSACELSAAAALLVRPDQHVAWRSHMHRAQVDQAAALRAALVALSAGTTARSSDC